MPYDGRLLSGLTVLMAVVEAGSMARAAEGLGLTSSGVGRAVARLEARLGVRLLERTTRTLTLTDEGRRFHEEVGPYLDGIEEAALAVAGAAVAVRGRLRVNVDPFFSRAVLADRMATFLARHPELCLELIMRDAVGDLVADGFDLAVRFGELPASALVARKLVDVRVLTVAAPAYLTGKGSPTHPGDVARHDCIGFYDAANARAYDWEFRRGTEVVTVDVRPRLVVSDVGAMLGACEAGAGIAQVLSLGTREAIDGGRLTPILTDWSEELFPLYVLFPSRQHRAAKVRAFVDFCIEALSALDKEDPRA